jgi:flavin-dependent dehydrogenase
MAIDRAALDLRMTETAISSGATLLLGTNAVAIRTDSSQVTVDVIREEETSRLTARSAVIASGLSPTLTRSLGMGRVADAALGFQLDVEIPAPTDVEIFLGRDIAPGFFGWLAPVSNNQARLGLIARRRADADLNRFAGLLRSQGKIGRALGEVRCRAIPLSILPRTYAQRVLVVGDAAGQVKSTTGGGLYYGLVCADLAAETLNQALLGDRLTASSLSIYQRRWRQALGHDLFLGRLARNVFQRLGDRQIDRLLQKANDSGLIERLLADESVTFDRHGKAIMKAAGGLWPAAIGW